MYLWAGALAAGGVTAAFAGVRAGILVGLVLLVLAIILTRRPVRVMRTVKAGGAQ